MLAALVLATALAPPIRVETARRGPLRAVLAYRDLGGATNAARVRIWRAGRRLVDDRLLPVCPYCAVASPTVSIRDLDRDGRPEVVVDANLGGAHAIPYTTIYSPYSAPFFYRSSSFDRIVHIWGGYGVERRDLDGDGALEFVSRDPRFFGRFDCLACSGSPIQIWQFRRGRFVDATRRFPRAIVRDLRTFRSCVRELALDDRLLDARVLRKAGDRAHEPVDELLVRPLCPRRPQLRHARERMQ